MDYNEITTIASQLRNANNEKSNIFTISTTTLQLLLTAFEQLEEQSSSFQFKQPPTSVNLEVLRDTHYLSKYIELTKHAKIYNGNDVGPVTVSHFKSLQSLKLYNIDVERLMGLQLLRPQLQKLTCHRTHDGLNKLFTTNWNELKEASFEYCDIDCINDNIEFGTWLHTLDLSHNALKDFTNLSHLANLKNLNLSYNNLESVSFLKGQICTRLQNLILKNNFIEHLNGLQNLNNLWLLDLSNNSLMEHKCLVNISHLLTLQFLNLVHNPMSYHPNHRVKSASYLHHNVGTINFVLDETVLSSSEKRFVGSYHPLRTKNMTYNDVSNVEKTKKIRNVVIEEEEEENVPVCSLPPTPQSHLETKRQIEDLREKFGESWLNSQSGLVDVLGLDTPSIEVEISSEDEIIEEAVEAKTADTPELDEDEEIEVENEDSIYLATVHGETIFLVIESKHLLEKECETGNEREKWHLDSILKCEVLDGGMVQIDFETMRKDRKQRVYGFEEELEGFVECVRGRMKERIVDEVRFLCMKCSTRWGLQRSAQELRKGSVCCKNCDSNLVVEDV